MGGAPWPNVGQEAAWLKAAGLKVTPQRVQVVRAMGSLSHPTPELLFRKLGTVRPRISLATVYNTLETLESRKLLNRVEAGGTRYYDTRLDRHWHLRCQGCQRIADVPAEGAAVPANALGWRLEWMEMVGIGYCPECQGRESSGS